MRAARKAWLGACLVAELVGGCRESVELCQALGCACKTDRDCGPVDCEGVNPNFPPECRTLNGLSCLLDPASRSYSSPQYPANAGQKLIPELARRLRGLTTSTATTTPAASAGSPEPC